MNRERTRTISVSEVLQNLARGGLIKAEGAFALVDVLVADRAVLVAQIKYEGNDDADAYTDAEKQAVCGKRDGHHDHNHRSDQQAGGTFYVDGHAGKHESVRTILVL